MNKRDSMSKLISWATRAHAVPLLCATTAIALQAQTFTTLHRFDQTDGLAPFSALVQATDGSLYGTTFSGGTIGSCGPGATCGNVFKITPTGTLTPLFSFDITDGDDPLGALIQATDGDFFGTTIAPNDAGTIFKITPTGLTTFYTFCSQSACGDGAMPYAGLIQASDGNFYGTTVLGGANFEGTVFKITPSGVLTTLYSFCSQSGCTDGEQPETGLVQAANGNFYGTTTGGGTSDSGTIFEITPSGAYTRLHSFCSRTNCSDGSFPSSLIQATDGNLYGTTERDNGTVFKITPSGAYTTLYRFCPQPPCTDGSLPGAGLVQATDGNFYGTTVLGGANGYGTIFKITSNGALTTLYSFCSQPNCTDGYSPEAALVQDTNGTFYGTTASGGRESVCHGGCGTVFNLSVGLHSFVETQRTSGEVGKEVKILGTNLTGATSVTFNGTLAVFVVDSSSLITATIPAGATSGRVQVTTPLGTLTSNVPFRVLP